MVTSYICRAVGGGAAGAARATPLSMLCPKQRRLSVATIQHYYLRSKNILVLIHSNKLLKHRKGVYTESLSMFVQN